VEVRYLTTVKDREKAKNWIQQQVQIIKSNQEQAEDFASFLKYFSNLVERVEPRFTVRVVETATPEHLSVWFEKLCEFMMDESEEHYFIKTYKTSELAKFMGVTVATVNNWIKESRLRGIVKENKFAHASIPETAIFLTQSNEPMTIKEIAELYYTEMEKHTAQTPKEDEMLEVIKYFNQKYNGTYFETLSKKETLSEQEKRDDVEWRYILRKLGLLNE
jgi:transcriptional regulator with XRE-family HTH domain